MANISRPGTLLAPEESLPSREHEEVICILRGEAQREFAVIVGISSCAAIPVIITRMILRRARGEFRCIRRTRLTINRTTSSLSLSLTPDLFSGFALPDRSGVADLLFRAYRYPRYSLSLPFLSLNLPHFPPPLSLSRNSSPAAAFCKPSSAGLATCFVRSSNPERWLPATSVKLWWFEKERRTSWPGRKAWVYAVLTSNLEISKSHMRSHAASKDGPTRPYLLD